MGETHLKKSFTEKDVARLRNLVTGKYGEKTTVGVGYEKQKETHEEGDIWEEDGRTWTIKNGIKQNITKYDKAKQEVTLPLFCPCCKHIMKNSNDKLFYIQYKRCFNCQVDFETEIKKKGLWKEYETNIINKDIDFLIEDFNKFTEDLINDSINTSFYTENGDVEQWVGSNIKQILENKEETIKYLQSLKK